MVRANAVHGPGSSHRAGHHLGLYLLAAYRAGKTAAQSLLVVVLSVVSLQATEPHEQIGSNFYFPSYAAYADPNSSSCVCTVGPVSGVPAGSVKYTWKMVSGNSDGETKVEGSGWVRHTGSAFTMTLNGNPYSIYALEVVNNGGTVYMKTPGASGWTSVGPSGSNLVSNFQGQYVSFLDGARGEGYPWNVSLGTWLAFLNGVAAVPESELEGNGGTPGPIVTNPPGGSATSTTTGGTTTTTTTGNATVNQTTTTTYNYTYNYTTDNSVVNEGDQITVDLAPVTAAVNANGEKIDATNDKLDYLTDHVIDGQQAIVDAINAIDGGGTAGPVVGTEPGEAPDVGAGVGAAITSGEGAASSKYGTVTSAMALSGHGDHSITFAIPWAGGGTESYTIHTLPESGSSLDSFRLILRTFLGVVIGIAFIFLTIKTLRFY